MTEKLTERSPGQDKNVSFVKKTESKLVYKKVNRTDVLLVQSESLLDNLKDNIS